jgi:hypothetical protein
MTLEEALADAQRLDAQRQSCGFNQVALDEAARQGFANGAFEDSADEAEAVVEEFFPEAAQDASERTDQSAGTQSATPRLSLTGKLDAIANQGGSERERIADMCNR